MTTVEQMHEMIRAEGALAVRQLIATGALQRAMTDGLDLTRWQCRERNGMVLLTLHAGVAAPSDPEAEERVALERRLRELRVARYHDGDARHEADTIQQRLNALGHEALDDPPASDNPALAGILCVNTPEARRSEFAAEITDDGYPVTLLMQEQAFAVAPF